MIDHRLWHDHRARVEIRWRGGGDLWSGWCVLRSLESLVENTYRFFPEGIANGPLSPGEDAREGWRNKGVESIRDSD